MAFLKSNKNWWKTLLSLEKTNLLMLHHLDTFPILGKENTSKHQRVI